jgi:hypothetical protein
LLLEPSKGATIYVIDRNHMGKFHPDEDAVVQMIKIRGGGYGAMAYWNGHAFFAASDDYLCDYAIKNGELKLSASSGRKFANPGTTPSVSADGKQNAIVWVIRTKTWNGSDRPAILYAYNAKDIRQPTVLSKTANAVVPPWQRVSLFPWLSTVASTSGREAKSRSTAF